MNKKQTEYSITKLLKTKHEEDIFVSQCKTGASFGNRNLGIIDGWAMKKSWSNPLYIGYEIKVSKQDFLHDDKWQKYLPFCNQFYFVCPYGMIDKNEIPEEVGLMYVSKTGTKLYTKKKAKFRNVEIPDTIFRYILMSRTKIDSDSKVNKKDFWENWLHEKKLDLKFGSYVSKSISETVKKRIDKVEHENEKLLNENKKLQKFKEILEKLGFRTWHVNNWGFEDSLKTKLDEIKTGFSKEFKNNLNSAKKSIESIIAFVEE